MFFLFSYNALLVKLILSIALIILLFGCGGGGGSNDFDSNNVDNDGITNSGLSGYLFFEGNDNAYLMNIMSGIYTKIPNTDWDRQLDRFDSGSLFYIRPVLNDHSEFIITAHDCELLRPYGSRSCVAIQSYNGEYNGFFVLPESGEVYTSALSPDKRYIAMFINYNNNEWLEIRNRNGEIVSDGIISSNNGDYAWLPSGRIIYAYGRRFMFTFENSAITEYYLELPNGIYTNSDIGNFSVSHDGQNIAFELHGSDGIKPYILNIASTSVRQLADCTSGNEFISIREPTWSPDNKWILVTYGSHEVPGNAQVGSAAYYYAVPVDNENKVYIISAIDEERSPEVKSILRNTSLDNDVNQGLTDRALVDRAVHWIP